MAKITLGGEPINTNGDLPSIDSKVKDFILVSGDLSEKSLADFSGKRKILNIVPSLDTGICATSSKIFNSRVANLENTVVLVISADLPFAQGRFCEVEGVNDAIALSTFRSSFASDWGLEIIDSPLKGLCSRAVIVLDEEDRVLYTEQVPEIKQEPDYGKALAVL